MKITVNGDEFVWSLPTIGYSQIVGLAYPGRTKPPLMSITYSWRGDGDVCRGGIIAPNDPPIAPADGMIFGCYHTGNA